MSTQQLRVSMGHDAARQFKAMAQLTDISLGDLVSALIAIAALAAPTEDPLLNRIQKAAQKLY